MHRTSWNLHDWPALVDLLQGVVADLAQSREELGEVLDVTSIQKEFGLQN